MSDTMLPRDAPSGRFVLRLPPELHGTLRDAASRAGLSLNEYCVRALAAPGTDPTGPGAAVAARAVASFGPDLVGVVLYGSWVRGEATAASDIDALVVLDASRKITRTLYHEWDGEPLEHEGHAVEVHFVGMPPADGDPGSVWLEVALDGVVAFDRDGRIARCLGQVRRHIAAGDRVRRRAHGHPYWTVNLMRDLDLAVDDLKPARVRLGALGVLYAGESWADVVRESQEVVELALKALLRASGVDVPRVHDVAPILHAERARLPESLAPHIDELANASRQLRRDRELAFYGAEDLTPGEFYTQADADRALASARRVVDLVSRPLSDAT